MRLPHCIVCKKEGDCRKGTMIVAEVKLGYAIYLCPEHYKQKEEIVKYYLASMEKSKKKKGCHPKQRKLLEVANQNQHTKNIKET